MLTWMSVVAGVGLSTGVGRSLSTSAIITLPKSCPGATVGRSMMTGSAVGVVAGGPRRPPTGPVPPSNAAVGAGAAVGSIPGYGSGVGKDGVATPPSIGEEVSSASGYGLGGVGDGGGSTLG